MVGKLDQALKFSEVNLRLRAERQQILASNIANADTPNYKARDIDFTKALQMAMSNVTGSALAATDPGHVRTGPSVSESISGAPLLYRKPLQGSVDGNTVDMDVERNQFADNAIRYEAGVSFVNSKLRGILAAIQG